MPENKEHADVKSVLPLDEIISNDTEVMENDTEVLTKDKFDELLQKAYDDLTDEEKKELFIRQLKQSKIHFKNTVHKGNVTITKFGAEYRKKRQRKNKEQKASRKGNRKK